MDIAITAKVKQGTVRGSIYKTTFDTFYIAFLSVPYAAPPIDNLRFMDPQPPHSWEGVLDCQTHKNKFCIQKVIWPSPEIIGTEDCLYLNIYVPLRLSESTQIAVMVWIHGGHFMNGSGNLYDAQPDYFMEKDIILVTVNYRLGAFGFLNLNHRLASGNQGLKDQVAALMWINENIAAFGGNPNNITLFGTNAGAICVHLLMLSPLSKDLFHKAILQSGVGTVNWRRQNIIVIEHSHRLATELGINASDYDDIIASLKRASGTDIINGQYDMLTQEEINGRHIFGPSIDSSTERPFFSFSPGELLYNGNVKPIMLGNTSLEYMRFLKESTQEKLLGLYFETPMYPNTLLRLETPQVEMDNLGRQFQEYYFNNTSTPSLLTAVLRCHSDIFFNIPMKMIADIQRHKPEATTYLYKFSYVGNQKIVDKNVYCYDVNLPVTSQNDDLAYLFFLPKYKDVDTIVPPSPRTDDFKMIQVMTSMWTNFAQTGDPTPFINKYIPIKWKPATKENFYYLDIDKDLGLLTITD